MSKIRVIENAIPSTVPPIGKRWVWVDNLGRINSMNYLGTITTMGNSSADYIKMQREISVLNITATVINTNVGILNVTNSKTINILMNADIPNLILSGLDGVYDESNNPINMDGSKTIINFIQDSVGGRTVIFSPEVIYPLSISVTPLDGTPDSIDVGEFMYSHALDRHKFMSFLHGFNI